MAEMTIADPLLTSAGGGREHDAAAGMPAALVRRAIESDAFPFEFLSRLAERDSWRKEVHRPIYHMHKWWAKRLGSVFRGLLLGSVLPAGTDVRRAFYTRQDLRHLRVFDPFMGSGTTIGEATKLGFTVLGRDINPVAYETVRVALGPLDVKCLKAAYHGLEETVGRDIRNLYAAIDEQGRPCEVLYYFWVKCLPCPKCRAPVDLRASYVFARNAYPGRKPAVQVSCPGCGGVFASVYSARVVGCPHCALAFDQERGPVHGQRATCGVCQATFSIAATIRSLDTPPEHRLYAKLVWTADGEKRYLPATAADRAAYHACVEALGQEERNGHFPLPTGDLTRGYNTRQALSYNYRTWREFFNARQLLALGRLHRAILALPQSAERDALRLLFSGVLEFNNVFASYKGEGTGAVRHMFAHHVLKPERTPLEANVWGTPRSSGSFSTLFGSRLLRALQYRARPYELSDDASDDGVHGVGGRPKGGKVTDISQAMGACSIAPWPTDGRLPLGAVALSCGSSDATALSGASVDLVVTDPPFFDNVHYSELADFFYAWQLLDARDGAAASSTRHVREVQDGDPAAFARKLTAVWSECHRVLRDDGLLVFTYHHSRPEGWAAMAEALAASDFVVVQAHPVRSEMAGATPKHQAKQPILYDAVLVCRKVRAYTDPLNQHLANEALPARVHAAYERAMTQATRLARAGFTVGTGDAHVLLNGQLLVGLTGVAAQVAALVADAQADLRRLADDLVQTAVATREASGEAREHSSGCLPVNAAQAELAL